jgi:3-mercaptopyruvate sulfurtransferase SseA
MKFGYDRVGVIHGGYDAWLNSGLPTQPRSEVQLPVTGTVSGNALAPDSSA